MSEAVVAKRPRGRPRKAPLSPAPVPTAETVVDAEPSQVEAIPPQADPPVIAAPKVRKIIEAAASPAKPSDSIPARRKVPAAKPKESSKMATITKDSVAENADKVQAMFGDMSSRFKAALEKSQKLGEELVELTKGNVEAVVASARVAAKGGETIGQEVGEYGRKSLESAVATLKSFASVKSPTELFQIQSDYAKASFDAAVAEASKLSESLLKLAGEAAQPLSSRYAVAAEKIKAATL